MKPAVIVIMPKEGFHETENKVIGPFESGNMAANWAFNNLKHVPNDRWYWLPLESPNPKGN